MAMARRISLFERHVELRLAPVAVELLHGNAHLVSEGELASGRYTGSTMMTVDLTRARDRISDAPDAATATRVAVLYAADEHCRVEARRVALGEARRVAGCDLGGLLVDLESRARGPEIQLSLDVEARVTPGAVRGVAR
jgi:hypothetical protein